MLSIGDTISYPMHGAGIIEAVETCEVQGQDREYYVLKLPMGSLKVMIPVDNADNIGLRDIISAREAREVVAVLREKPDRAVGSWNKRFHANLERMKKGDLKDVAAVARNLMLQDKQRKVSSGERRVLDLAKQILVSELVYALNLTPEDAEEQIEKAVTAKRATKTKS